MHDDKCLINYIYTLKVMLKPAVHPDTVQMLSWPPLASPSSPSMSYSGPPRHHSSGRKKKYEQVCHPSLV